MTDEEITVVAKELAKSGGTSWYSGRVQGPLMQVVTDLYREQARVVIAAPDHLRTGGGDTSQMPDARRVGPPATFRGNPISDAQPGTTIIYRPPGDRRAYPFLRVEIQGTRDYLAPILRTCVGWMSIERLETSTDDQSPGS